MGAGRFSHPVLPNNQKNRWGCRSLCKKMKSHRFASFNLDSPSDKLSADVKIRQALEPAGETLELRRTAGLACLKANISGDNPGETHQHKF